MMAFRRQIYRSNIYLIESFRERKQRKKVTEEIIPENLPEQKT